MPGVGPWVLGRPSGEEAQGLQAPCGVWGPATALGPKVWTNGREYTLLVTPV